MRYQETLDDIRVHAQKIGRNPDDITLVAVTKNHPLEAVLELYCAGCRHFGENRLQEALPKIAGAPTDIQWHFIGTLQKNKVGKVLDNFSWIHSVDTPDLAKEISKRAQEKTSILLQVNTSGEASKHGLSPQKWKDTVQEIFQLPNLDIKGLMTMAPYTDDIETIRHCFSGLRQFRDELEADLGGALPHLSMGMSRDYRIAIEEGATLLRVGSVIFSGGMGIA